MGLIPPLKKWPDFPAEMLGWSMAAYYGGRVESRIHKHGVPVTYVDFTSMYPTVNALIGLWGVLTAERLEVVDCTADLQALLDQVTLEDCFNPRFWRQLVAFGEIVPDGEIVPVRAQWRANGGDLTIGLNPLPRS